MQKLNEFSKTELANEPSGDVISSDSIFAGVFTLLSNLLSMPNCNCLGFNNLETIVSHKLFSALLLSTRLHKVS